MASAPVAFATSSVASARANIAGSALPPETVQMTASPSISLAAEQRGGEADRAARLGDDLQAQEGGGHARAAPPRR